MYRLANKNIFRVTSLRSSNTTLQMPGASGPVDHTRSRRAGRGVRREPAGVLRRGPGPAGPALIKIRHSLPCVLALCTAAVLCGNTAVEDVTAWVHAAPQEVLAAAGARRNALGARVAPHPETVVRLFTALGAQGVAHHAGAYLARRADPGPVAFPVAGPGWLPAVAVDGKAVRGAAGDDGLIPYLLAAVTHGTGAVLAERLIGPKTSEVPEFAPLLRELNQYYLLAGHVITADAGHHRPGPRRVHLRGAPGALRLHRQAEHPPAVGGAGRAGLGIGPGPARHRGERPWPARAPHHPGHERPRAHPQAVPARPPGRPDRAVRHPDRPREEGQALGEEAGEVRRGGVHHHQPGRPRGRPRPP